MSLLTRVLNVLAVLILLSISSPAKAEGVSVIVTADLESVYYPTGDGGERKPFEALSEAVRKERERNEHVFYIDAGNSASALTLYETGYNGPPARAILTLGADVVHLTAGDVMKGANRDFGLPAIKDSAVADKIISRLGYKLDGGTSYAPKAARRVEKNGAALEVLSLAEPDAVRGWTGARERFVETPIDQVLSAAGPSAARIAISEMDLPVVERIAAGKDAPPMIVSLSTPRDGKVRTLKSGAQIVNAPPSGSYLRIDFPPTGAPTVETVPFLDPESAKALVSFPLPSLGVGIQNAQEALPKRLGVDPELPSPDVYDAAPFKDLTKRDKVYVFRAQLSGKPVRIYRFQSSLPLTPVGGVPTAHVGWPMNDLIVALDENRRIAALVSRQQPAVIQYTFALDPVVDGIRGKDPAEWNRDSSLLPGARVYLDWLFADLERTIELDRRLYGEASKKAAE